GALLVRGAGRPVPSRRCRAAGDRVHRARRGLRGGDAARPGIGGAAGHLRRLSARRPRRPRDPGTGRVSLRRALRVGEGEARSARLSGLGDRRILYAAAFLRALGTGMIGILLGIYLGRLAAGMPALLRGLAVPDLMALRLAVGTCALLTLLPAVLYLGLSPAIDVPREEAPARLSPESRSVLRKISALFALDALGGGF